MNLTQKTARRIATAATAAALAAEGAVHALLAIAAELRDLRSEDAAETISELRAQIDRLRAELEQARAETAASRAEFANESRERVLKHAARRLSNGAAAINAADDYRRGLRHGYSEAANALQYGLSIQPRDLFWADAPASGGPAVAEAARQAVDRCKDCGVPRAGGRILHATSCLPG